MATYYVSASGCYKNDGLTPDTPWQTIKKANSTVIGGDTVCFKRGDTFFGQIRAPKENNSGVMTKYTSYGEGSKPMVSQYKTAKKGVKYRYTVKAVNGKTASAYKSSASVKR